MFSFLGLHAYSQQQYFVYIQAENNQPFYVRMNEKIHSSSETGYLILSKLTDNKYEFFIGFARNAYPEQHFTLSVGNQDRGYQLKQFGDKGWGLADLQSQQVVMNTDAARGGSTLLLGEKKTDPFSVMLATVVNDSAILYTPVKPAEPVTVAKTEVKTPDAQDKQQEALVKQEATAKADTPANNTVVKAPATVAEKVEAQKDSPAITSLQVSDSNASAAEAEVKKPVTEKPAMEKPFITRIKESNSPQGYEAVYLEQYNYSTDTIDIHIAADAAASSATTAKKEPEVEQAADNQTVQQPAARKDSSTVVLQMGSVTDTFTVKKKTIIMINSDCRNFATENDVDKLRVRLLGEKTIDDKLSTARKYYKNKCFTVKQLRALTELFPTDETKYRFLDLSYAFASDSGNYYLLEEVMGEDYYKNRFRAMIRK